MSTDRMVELAPLPPTMFNISDPELRYVRLRGFRVPNPLHGECITCEGRKEFKWWNPEDKSQVATWRCNCRNQFKLHTNFLHANLKLAHQGLGWDDVVAVEPGAVAKVEAYLDKASLYANRGVGLMLYGKMGTGKTTLAVLSLKHMMGLGYRGYFTTFSELLASKMTSWDDTEGVERYTNRIRGAKVLVLDDLGKEHHQRRFVGAAEADRLGTDPGIVRHSLEVAQSTLDDLLRHRVATASPTIITSNLSLTEIGNNYGDSIVSLLRESFSTYEFVGEDWRDNARARTHDEIEMGLTRPVVLR